MEPEWPGPDAAAFVREQAAMGFDSVKFLLSNDDVFIPGGSQITQYTQEEASAAGEQARESGVWLNCHARDWPPSFFERVAAMGLAIASADYRLSGEAHFPAQLDDVAAAANFLSTQRKLFGVRTERTVAWGVSAGGHLCARHALRSPDHLQIDAVVCWYTPTDLDALAGDCDEAGGHGDQGLEARESQLIGVPLDERPDLAAAASAGAD